MPIRVYERPDLWGNGTTRTLSHPSAGVAAGPETGPFHSKPD